MIKVIQEAKFQVRCYRCCSLLEFSVEDVSLNQRVYDYTGSYDLEDILVCPVCTSKLSVKLK